MASTIPSSGTHTVDGVLSDWTSFDRIDHADVAGYSVFARAQGDQFYFAISAPVAIGPNTTVWFNTDQNAATGFQIFGFTGGAELNLNIKSDGTAALYSGAAGETLVLDNIPLAYSADHQSIEFAIAETALGNPTAIDSLYDINDSVFLPANYSAEPYTVYNDIVARTDQTHKIGIVYSETTANNYFDKTAYSQLFMAAQSQAMQAGISFDLLNESDLTNLAKLANYDALVFPSFTNVQASQASAIANTLEQASRLFGIGLVAAGNFMTNDETGAALPGDAYARMKLLFDATRVTGGTADVSIYSSDLTQTVFSDVTPGALIRTYAGAGWDAFTSVSGTGQTIATEVVDGQTYTAALATETGGRNVLFSTPGVMADSNLLWQAIDHAANDPGISVGLHLTRNKSIVASRTDMDQSQESFDVNPEDGSPGIYDNLLPALAQWKQAYNFVSSYYVNIGNNPANGQFTNWAVSLPYYAQLLAMGNEIGTHSYTHPEDTNPLTAAQIQFEFQQSKLVLEQHLSAYLGHPFTISGAAVPGMPEKLPASEQIIQYFDYLSGGYAGVGAGYPGAFGFLTPDLASSVYIAPNMSFDFTLVEFQHHTPAEAEALWAQEWDQLTANASTPIVVWPWHDYGSAQWSVDPGVASPYTLAMYTDWIAMAAQSGAEFVTLADLASRIESFANSGVTSTVSGNVITASVASAHAGDFALNVAGQGGQVIQNVGNWYAYDEDSVFLPELGGNFTITLGLSADDVTHIIALPMRADLISVTGNGLNLGFSLWGEGQVVIDLGAHGSRTPFVSGASIASLAGDRLELTLTGLGQHDVSLLMVGPAPVLADTALALSAINEDATAPAGAVGDLVSTLMGGITDVDNAPIKGIAITAADAANGTWFYSTNNGANWAALGAVSNTAALLLVADAATRVYFQPTANFSGSLTSGLTIRAWDITNGIATTKVDTSTNGGTTAFSAATDTVAMTVNAVNDAPVLADTVLTLSTLGEDAAAPTGAVGDLVSTLVGGISDVDVGAVQGVAITAADANGTWFFSTDNGANWTAFGAVSDTAALLLAADATTRVYFQPNANFSGAITTGLTLRAWDTTNGLAGTQADTSVNGGATAFSVATDTVAITVNAVNDAPVLADTVLALSAINEDAAAPTGAVGDLVSTLVGGITDADSGAVQGIAITAADAVNGTWFYSTDNGATWTAMGAVSDSSALLLAADATTRVYFQPNANFSGAITTGLTLRAWDTTGGAAGAMVDASINGGATAFSAAVDTVAVTVTAVNDAPVLADTVLTMSAITEDATAPSGAVGDLVSTLVGGISDIDSGAVQGIAITAADAANGTWFFSTDNGAIWTAVGAVSDTAALLLAADAATRVYFQPNANFSGTLATALTLRAWDTTSGAAGTMVDASANGGATAFSTATDTVAITVKESGSVSAPTISVFNTTTGQPVPATGHAYQGPVAGLQAEYINITQDSLNISVSSDNWFIHSGSGQDAIAVHGGTNVLDGGTGSNFLVGSTAGFDTFFIDDRGATKDIWSTLVNFHAGDACTFWGVDKSFTLDWQNNQGAVGYTGLTLHAIKAGAPIASMTLTGYSKADLDSGRVSIQFGFDPASGSNYMYIHGDR